MLYRWKGSMPSTMESRGAGSSGHWLLRLPQLPLAVPHGTSPPTLGVDPEEEGRVGGGLGAGLGQDGCQPPGTDGQGVRVPRQPSLTLDKGCGGCPVTLHLPARAAVPRLCCHPLPFQDVGDHWGQRCLPVHPEAALAPWHGPEPGQGLTCMGQAAGMMGEGSTSPTSPPMHPGLESVLSLPWLCTPWQPARGEQSPGGRAEVSGTALTFPL